MLHHFQVLLRHISDLWGGTVSRVHLATFLSLMLANKIFLTDCPLLVTFKKCLPRIINRPCSLERLEILSSPELQSWVGRASPGSLCASPPARMRAHGLQKRVGQIFRIFGIFG